LVSQPEFDLMGVAKTTYPDVPMLIGSGSIVKQLGINSGSNALGRGWREYATISRALNFIIQNIGGSWPGITDMSTIGQPGDFAMMLAENAEANPWAPLHVELGHAESENVLTILVAGGTGEKGMLVSVWSASSPVSKEIRLPSNWLELGIEPTGLEISQTVFSSDPFLSATIVAIFEILSPQST
jgi:hypothetical protein